MPDRDTIIASIETYCRALSDNDKTAWLALMADNIRHEDPIGAPLNEGIEKMAAFWDAMQPFAVELWLSAPVIVCGNEAIAPMWGRMGPASDRKETGQVFDHMVFNDAGKIVSLRAFYEPF